jgi:hypothetical protein
LRFIKYNYYVIEGLRNELNFKQFLNAHLFAVFIFIPVAKENTEGNIEPNVYCQHIIHNDNNSDT